MANINLDMTMLYTGLTPLPELMHMTPHGAAIVNSFHHLQKRYCSSASHLHQEQPHVYQETVLESMGNFTWNAAQK